MFVFVMAGVGAVGNVTVKLVWEAAADIYGVPPAPRLGNAEFGTVVPVVAEPGTMGPCGVAVNVRVAPADAPPVSVEYVEAIGMTDAEPGEMPDMALSGMSRPGFSVPDLPPVTVMLTLLVDEPAR
jgi:hypothetical protein